MLEMSRRILTGDHGPVAADCVVRRRIALVLVLALVGVACTETPSETTPSSTSTTSTVSTAPTTTAGSVSTGQSVQAAIDWFVALLDQGTIDEADYEDRFAQVFRDAVSFEAFNQVVFDLRRSGPYVVVDRSPDGTVGFAIVENETGTRLRVNASLDADGRFEGLLVQPESFPEMANPPETMDAAFELLDRVGTFGGIAAEITDGSCVPVASLRPDEPVPLGSAFKLYVLGALALEIEAGTITWDTELVITDDVKSIPTGVLQDRESGSVVTVRRAAELMISISDNTAADLIARRLGRNTVEGRLDDLGMSDPQITIPFPTTLEFSVLKIHADDATRQAYVDGDASRRLEILESLAGVTVDQLVLSDFVDPIEPDTIEWFATPGDLCRLAVALTDLSRRDGLEPIGEVLGLNPGIPDDDGRWQQIWFKGGSEPGLLAMWWTVEDDAGRRFVLAGSSVDPERNLATDDALLVWSATRDLLGVVEP